MKTVNKEKYKKEIQMGEDKTETGRNAIKLVTLNPTGVLMTRKHQKTQYQQKTKRGWKTEQWI